MRVLTYIVKQLNIVWTMHFLNLRKLLMIVPLLELYKVESKGIIKISVYVSYCEICKKISVMINAHKYIIIIIFST